MYRDAGYARISSDDLRMGRGVGRQTKDIERRSTETGGQVVAMFFDNDYSASKYARRQRKDYPRLVDLARAGGVDRIIVYRLDRLLRIPSELEELIKIVEQRNVLVVNMNGSLDLTTAEGIKYARDRVADAAYESDILSERLKRTFDESALEGRPHGRRAFGYACSGRHHPEDCAPDRRCGHRQDPDEHPDACCRHCHIPGCPHDGLSIIPHEAEALRQAARDVLAGESMTGIARRWNAKGLTPAHQAAEWSQPSVRSVLTGRHQAGLRVHRGEVVGQGAWEPIIDVDTHEALRRVLLDPDRRRKLPPRRGEFSGLIRTPEGHILARDVVRGRPTYRYSRTPGRSNSAYVTIAAEPLEDLIRELLFQEVEAGRVAERVADRRKAAPAAVGPDPAELRRKLVQLAEDEANEVISRAEWLAKRSVLEERLRSAEAMWARVDDTLEALSDVGPDVRERWRVPARRGGWSVDRKRAILAAVFDRVVIHPAVRKGGPGLDPRRVEPVYRA